ncbi:MAG TPA: hypothetical protein EYO33_03575 [Phycisphaerales bacterium]|nr:hypothetical protein [Phycisphaerales bacterium]
MNINSNSTSSIKASVLQQADPAFTRPVSERWLVGGERGSVDLDTFESTGDLVKSDVRKHGRQATYEYVRRTAEETNNGRDRAMNALQGALTGGVALGGMMLPLVLIGGFFNTLAPRMFDPVTVGMFAGVVGIGVTGGAISGALKAPEADKGQVTGVLQNRNDTLEFYPYDRIDTKVDLKVYQSAQTPEPGENGVRDYGRQWWN